LSKVVDAVGRFGGSPDQGARLAGRPRGTEEAVMPLIAAPVLLALVAVYAYCLADFARTPEWEIRTFDRQTWILLLIFTNVVGGLMWLRLGRPPRRPTR
jgi:hypothetical protein